ncbi:MAG: lipopolysaccharide assembly protein LapA domain-containing protein [Gaiellaceae bacterium]
MSTTEPAPEAATGAEPRRERLRRGTRRTRLYVWAFLLVALLIVLVALIVANTRRVQVSWVFGSTHQSLVWIILVAAIVGWLTGIVTSVLFRRRTRRAR